MDTIEDFEDFLFLLNKFKVRYLIIGGLAFIFHAKPRYTKDMDVWIDPEIGNIKNINRALAEFGSPYFISLPMQKDEILRLGVAPDRIDIFLRLSGVEFANAWDNKIESAYGSVDTYWIDIDNLIKTKKGINSPRHQDDVQVLLKVKDRKA